MRSILDWILYIIGGISLLAGLLMSGDTYGYSGLYGSALVSSGISTIIAGAFASVIIGLPKSIVEQFKIEKMLEKREQEAKEKGKQ